MSIPSPILVCAAHVFADFIALFRARDAFYVPDDVHLTEVALAICAAKFDGGGGASEYKVMTAAWRIAVEAKTCEPALPLRRLTNEAGIGSVATTADALVRLSRDGWLEKVEHTNGRRGNRYRLCVPDEHRESVRKPGTITYSLGRCRDGEAQGNNVAGEVLEDSWLVKNDAFAYKALGTSAARLYILLIAASQTRSELADLTGLSRDTVRRNLLRLAEHGLAVNEGDQWRAEPFSAARLDAIAREYGTAGRREAQACRHESERQRNVLRQLDDIAGVETDPREWAMVDGGVLVNLTTGELPDVYGQFWPRRPSRPGVFAGLRSVGRAIVDERRRRRIAEARSTLEGYVETNLATTLPRPRAFRAVVDTPALQALAKRAGEVWMRAAGGRRGRPRARRGRWGRRGGQYPRGGR